MPDFVYTIGHSNHSIAKFIDLLTAHQINAVADVRSDPHSRFRPHFNREDLQDVLKTAGVGYAFLGRELGARSEDPDCYVNGKARYDHIARTRLFREGISRVVHGARSYRIALMCAEKDPLMCHRAILVSKYLEAQGIGVQHILEDGRIESHDAAISRLLAELGLEENDLFRSRDEMINDAYDKRGNQIAYSRHVSHEELAGRPQG